MILKQSSELRLFIIQQQLVIIFQVFSSLCAFRCATQAFFVSNICLGLRLPLHNLAESAYNKIFSQSYGYL